MKRRGDLGSPWGSWAKSGSDSDGASEEASQKPKGLSFLSAKVQRLPRGLLLDRNFLFTVRGLCRGSSGRLHCGHLAGQGSSSLRPACTSTQLLRQVHGLSFLLCAGKETHQVPHCVPEALLGQAERVRWKFPVLVTAGTRPSQEVLLLGTAFDVRVSQHQSHHSVTITTCSGQGQHTAPQHCSLDLATLLYTCILDSNSPSPHLSPSPSLF